MASKFRGKEIRFSQPVRVSAATQLYRTFPNPRCQLLVKLFSIKNLSICLMARVINMGLPINPFLTILDSASMREIPHKLYKNLFRIYINLQEKRLLSSDTPQALSMGTLLSPECCRPIEISTLNYSLLQLHPSLALSKQSLTTWPATLNTPKRLLRKLLELITLTKKSSFIHRLAPSLTCILAMLLLGSAVLNGFRKS